MLKPLDEMPSKKLMELELLAQQMISAMKHTSLQSEPIYAELVRLEQQLGAIRRTQFDAANPTFFKGGS